MSLQRIDLESINFNPFTVINKGWMLITAGSEKGYNTMTASWGSLGELWGYYTGTIHVRPQRYTKKFVDENDFFSLSFFPENYRDALSFCGSKSGRDYDKARECGLTPVFNYSAPYFQEANLVFICKKLYKQEMTADNFIDSAIIEKSYPELDFHTTYVGGIVEVLGD